MIFHWVFCLVFGNRRVFSFFILFLLFPFLFTAAATAENPEGAISPSDGLSAMETGRAFGLLDVYRMAVANDPTFMGEKYLHEASSESVIQARSELLPTLTAEGYHQQTKQKMLETDVAVYDQDTTRYPSNGYSVTLTQPIFELPSLVQLKQAKADARRADIQFESARQDLAMRVAEAYINALDALENLESSRAEEEALKIHFELAQGRFESGLSPITDYHDAKARLAYRTALRVRAETRMEDALEALIEISGHDIGKIVALKQSLVIGGEDDTEITADGVNGSEKQEKDVMPLVNPEPDDVGQWIETALAQNLNVLGRKQALEVAEYEIERQKGRHWPVLELVGEYNRDDQGGSLFGGGSDIETMEAMVQLNIPLYQGGYVASKVREARKRHLAVGEDLEKAVRRTRREVKAAFFGVKSAIKNAEALRHSVISSQIALEAKKEGYKSGLLPAMVILDAERDAYFAKREYVRAQLEYILNSLRLKQAVGALGEADLASINRWLE